MKTILSLVLAGGLLAPSLSFAASLGQSLPGLRGKFVQLKRTPKLAGYKTSTKMLGVDAGVEVWKRGNKVVYARELIDGGIMPSPYFKKLAR